MAILYVETNFILSIATGQDAEATDLLDAVGTHSRLIIPIVCFMEALSALEQKRGKRAEFERILEREIQELRRDRISSEARQLRTHLDHALIENTYLLRLTDTKLYDTSSRLFKDAEHIELTSMILLQGRRLVFLEHAPTDALIFASILEHARRHPLESQAFLSANTREFGSVDARQALGDAGIEKYFAEAKNVLGWLKSQPSRES